MMKTQKEVRAAFWDSLQHHRDLSGHRKHRGWKQNDYHPRVRGAFVEFVDMLARDGQISAALAQRVTL